jgi:hypothetical protein
MDSGWTMFAFLAVTMLFATPILVRKAPLHFQVLLMLGLIARIVGAAARYVTVTQVYERGDALAYYSKGLEYANRLAELDLSIFEAAERGAKTWWGTQFVEYVSGFVLLLIGPSLQAEFLVFAIFPFIGLILAVKTVHANYTPEAGKRYAYLVFFAPSLCFWPSSVGKESLMLLAIGLILYGYAGARTRIQWVPLGAGLLLAFVIRPHVSALIAIALGFTQVLRPNTIYNPRELLKTFVLGVLAILVVFSTLNELGVQDAQEAQELFDHRAGKTTQGGSAFERTEVGVMAIPIAFINMLFRPFFFESSSAVVLLAALEVLLFWLIVFLFRRTVLFSLLSFRTDRLLRLAAPLTFLFCLIFGLAFGNAGIIARQRVAILPSLFLFLVAGAGLPATRAGVSAVRAGSLPRTKSAAHSSVDPLRS